MAKDKILEKPKSRTVPSGIKAGGGSRGFKGPTYGSGHTKFVKGKK